MLNKDDDFESRLEHDLREWTDPAARPLDWTAQAREVIAQAAPTRGVVARRLIAMVAATGIVAAGGVVVLGGNLFNVVPTPTATTIAGSSLDLSVLAWWDEQRYEFGETSPSSSPAALPKGYNEVRVGTLDGRVTTTLRLSDAWSHSYVSGPVGTDVLVVDDDSKTSTIWLVSALDGSKKVVAEDSALITAAALSPTGDALYYTRVERRTGMSLGLWAMSVNSLGENARLVSRNPSGGPSSDLSVWHVLTSLDGKTIFVQSCVGEIQCNSYFIDSATGAARQLGSIGWPRGITDSQLLARGGSDNAHLVTVDLASLEVQVLLPNLPEAEPVRAGGRWFLAYAVGTGGLGETRLLSLDDNAQSPVPGEGRDPPGSAIHALADQFGVGLPDGWVIRTPDPVSPGAGQLINIVTGERITLNPFR